MNNELTSALPYLPPIIDIATGLDDSMAHSPDFSNLTNYSMNLTMSGSRSADRRNLLNNYPNAPATGHHCHHTYSYNYANGNASANMQLVAARTHIATYPHPGAVRQWNTSGNHQHRYRSIMEEAVTSPVNYSKEELAKFQSAFNTKIPAELADAYLNQSTITSSFRIKGSDETVHIAELLALFEIPDQREIPDVGYVIETLKRNGISIYTRNDDTNELMPYALDDCGNIFYYSFDNNDNVHYWFYDHEYDEYFEIEQ